MTSQDQKWRHDPPSTICLISWKGSRFTVIWVWFGNNCNCTSNRWSDFTSDSEVNLLGWKHGVVTDIQESKKSSTGAVHIRIAAMNSYNANNVQWHSFLDVTSSLLLHFHSVLTADLVPRHRKSILVVNKAACTDFQLLLMERSHWM